MIVIHEMPPRAKPGFLIAIFLVWNAVMAFVILSVDPAWRGLLLLATFLVDCLLGAWAVFVARREVQSGEWILHLESSAEPGRTLRGYLETPLQKEPRGGAILTFSSHSGDPMSGTKVGKTVSRGFASAPSGTLRIPVELEIPRGIPVPGYYREIGPADEEGTITWELLCQTGPPVIGYTARFEVPASVIHREEGR